MIVVQYHEVEGKAKPWDGNRTYNMFALLMPLEVRQNYYRYSRHVKDNRDCSVALDWVDPRNDFLKSFKIELIY